MNNRDAYRYPRGAWRSRYVSLSLGVFCLVPSLLGAFLSLTGWLPRDPTALLGRPDEAPSAAHWLGTDALGRDLFSRLADSSAHFAVPGALAVGVALSLGVALGVAGGLAGRGARTLARWLIQVLDAVPKFVFVLLVAATARSEILWIMAAVGVTFAPQVASAIQLSVDRLTKSAFIEAERSLGVGLSRIVFVHILWGHARRLLLAQLTSLAAYALLVESSLSYLGGELGIQEPKASWGNMIALARDGFFRGHLLPALLPAAAASVTLLGLSLLGKGLLETLEERS